MYLIDKLEFNAFSSGNEFTDFGVYAQVNSKKILEIKKQLSIRHFFIHFLGLRRAIMSHLHGGQFEMYLIFPVEGFDLL